MNAPGMQPRQQTGQEGPSPESAPVEGAGASSQVLSAAKNKALRGNLILGVWALRLLI
jgi:hypothetical protein